MANSQLQEQGEEIGRAGGSEETMTLGSSVVKVISQWGQGVRLRLGRCGSGAEALPEILGVIGWTSRAEQLA